MYNGHWPPRTLTNVKHKQNHHQAFISESEKRCKITTVQF